MAPSDVKYVTMNRLSSSSGRDVLSIASKRSCILSWISPEHKIGMGMGMGIAMAMVMAIGWVLGMPMEEGRWRLPLASSGSASELPA